MNKRAEQRALEAYPAPQLEGCSNILYDLEGGHREGFVNGYEQAEKDTLERVVKWLEENAVDYIRYKGAVGFPGQDDLKISKGMFSDLKKAMEE